MIFETIAGITAALSALNAMHDQVKQTGQNVGGLLQKAMDVTTGIHKYELEQRDSLVPADPQTILRIQMEKRKIERFNEELRLLGNMNTEAAKVVDAYFETIAQNKRDHENSLKAIAERAKQRKRLYKDLVTYSLLVITMLFGAAIVTTLFILWMKG